MLVEESKSDKENASYRKESDNDMIENFGLEMEEEQLGMVETKQMDKAQLRRQKTHAILTDPQLEDLINIKKKANLEMLGLKSEAVEVSWMGNVTVSLFWEEKIIIILHSLQLAGFYFLTYYEQMPSKYDTYTNIFAGFLLKFDIILNYNKSLTDYDFIFVYSLAWSGVCVLMMGIFFLLLFSGTIQKMALSGSYTLIKLGYHIFDILLFPCLMNTVPYAFCQLYTSKIGVTVCECWSETFQIIVAVGGGLVGACALVTAFLVGSLSNSNYVYDTNEQHEEFIKMKELEYVFDLSYIWRSNFYFLFASFRREGFALFFRCTYYLYIIILTVIFSSLSKHQELRFWIVILLALLFCIYITVKPIFRCMTTNIVHIVVSWGFVPTLLLLYLRTTGIRSALIMVDKNFATFTLSLALFILLLTIMVCSIFITLKIRWPIDMSMVEEVTTHPRFISMLGHLKEAKNLSLELANKRRYYFIDKSRYLEIIGFLEHDFKEADKMKHFFKDIILEFIEELSQYYQGVISESLLPHARLESVLTQMREVFLRRAREQILINPRRQKVLLYLLTFRMLYDQYWASTETQAQLLKAIQPVKLTPLEEMKFRKGEGKIDERHKNLLDEEDY